MTKKLESLFELPENQEVIEEEKESQTKEAHDEQYKKKLVRVEETEDISADLRQAQARQHGEFELRRLPAFPELESSRSLEARSDAEL